MLHLLHKSLFLLLCLTIAGCATKTSFFSQTSESDIQKNRVHNNCFQSIYGDKPDYNFAHQLCNQAADLHISSAQTLLGELYFFGLGIKQNYKQAFKFYETAANQDHPHAQFMLYHMYLQGLGNDVFPTQAKIWLQKSAKNGHPQALKIISSKKT